MLPREKPAYSNHRKHLKEEAIAAFRWNARDLEGADFHIYQEGDVVAQELAQEQVASKYQFDVLIPLPYAETKEGEYRTVWVENSYKGEKVLDELLDQYYARRAAKPHSREEQVAWWIADGREKVFSSTEEIMLDILRAGWRKDDCGWALLLPVWETPIPEDAAVTGVWTDSCNRRILIRVAHESFPFRVDGAYMESESGYEFKVSRIQNLIEVSDDTAALLKACSETSPQEILQIIRNAQGESTAT